MRKPTVHHTFKVSNARGLSSLLTRQNAIPEVIYETNVAHLHVIPSGPIPPNPAELIASQTMDRFIEIVSAEYDIVIFYAPPVLSVTDAQILANKCDGTILVVNTGSTEKENISKAKAVLVASKANMIGVILNKYVHEKDHYYYQYYGTQE